MRQNLFYIFISITFFSSLVYADSGLIRIQSDHDVKTTADHLEEILKSKGMTLFTRIDHALGAQKAGMKLRATELLIFGNPKVGTPLIHCSHSIAIDLPQKVLIWQDEGGKVWLSYNDPKYMAARHGIIGCEDAIKRIEKALSLLAHAATSP
ncbi:MAG: DUF302 domain-containing protein [Nitrospiria bacterium]